MREWGLFISNIRAQTVNAVQILSNLGIINQADPKLIQVILSANLETLSNPDAIGK